MVDWKEIHPDFDYRGRDWETNYKQEWINKGFSYETCKEWINIGLGVNETDYAVWLRDVKGVSAEWVLNHGNGAHLREEHKKYQDLKPERERIGKKTVNAQEWLYRQKEYNTQEKRIQIIEELNIWNENLEGSLVLTDFINLEEFVCSNNQLTNLDLSNCPQLTEIYCYKNQLTQLILPKNPNNLRKLVCWNNLLTELDWTALNPEKLTYLNLRSNNFSTQDLNCLAKFTQLKFLFLGNVVGERIKKGIYNHWTGSLEPLNNLSKLEKLCIDNTDISEGLEYLPASLESFWCSAEEREEAKVKAIYNLFANEQGVAKTEENGSITNFSRKFPLAKQRFQKEKRAKQQTKSRIEKTLASNGITLEQLHQQLMDSNYINYPTHTWQSRLEDSLNLKEINAWESHALEAIQTLKKLPTLANEAINNLEQNRLANNISEESLLKELKDWHEASIDLTNWKDYLRTVTTSLELSTRKTDVIETIQSLKNKFQAHSLLETEQEAHQQTEGKHDQLRKEWKNPLAQKELTTAKIEENQESSLIQDQTKEELIKLLIQKEMKTETIERITFCKTWFNENCAIVISKKDQAIGKDKYRLRIAVYEPAFGKAEAEFKLIKIIKKISKVKENWAAIIEHFRKSLDSNHPAAEIYNHPYSPNTPPLIKPYENISERKIKLSPNDDNPDNYLKSYDIVKRKMSIPGQQHVAVYLGDGKVAHISSSEEERNNRKDLGARIDTWKDFLKGETEIEIEHSFIPFKRPELIQEHIDIAISAKYGKGEYHLLRNNCEHFAKMCVYGVGMSQQSKAANTVSKDSGYLLKSIQESNDFFEKLGKEQHAQILQNPYLPKGGKP